MDPISAAGIGLSVASSALQVFSGCVTGMHYSLNDTQVIIAEDTDISHSLPIVCRR
jgi:hypothetical protein